MVSVKKCCFPNLGCILLLISINFLNFIDRGYLASVNINVISDFNLTNTQSGIISSSFLVGYLLFSPIFSWAVYRFNRIYLIIIGLFVWVGCVLACSFCYSYLPLVLCRLGVGVGEAAFSSIGPPIIDTYSPQSSSSRWLSFYYLAIPVGYALGFLYGGLLIDLGYIWQIGYLIESICMFLFALLLLFYRNIDKQQAVVELEENLLSDKKNYVSLREKLSIMFCDGQYIANLIVYVFYIFVIGSYSYWGPIYVIDKFHINETSSDYIFGGVTIVTGVVGTFLGGIILDKLRQRFDRVFIAYIINLICLVLGGIFCEIAFAVQNLYAFVTLLVFGAFFLFALTGPINSVFIWLVEKDNKYTKNVNNQLKSLSCSMMILFSHLLGDVPSPILTGYIQDTINNWSITMMLLTTILLFSIIVAIYLVVIKRRQVHEFNLL